MVLVDKVAKFSIADSIGVVVPVNNGLKLLSFMGDAAGMNKVINGDQFAKIGSPEKLGELISLCNEEAYVKTSQSLTESGTIIAAFKSQDPNNNVTVCGWYPNQNGQAGVSIVNTEDGKILAYAQLVNKSNPVEKISLTTSVNAQAKWVCVAIRWGVNANNVVEMKIDNLTEKLASSASSQANFKISTDTNFQPLAIGSGYVQGAEGAGPKMIAFGSYYDHSLSDVDLLKMHKYLKLLLLDQGVDV